jgi:hypothetical protein
VTTFRVIALDPGQTTGWATYTATRIKTPDSKLEWYDEEWVCGQLGPQDHHDDLFSLLELQHVQLYKVVCETFEFRGDDRTGINLMSREYIGVTKLFSQQRGVVVEWQGPHVVGDKKAFVMDHHVKRVGLWVPGQRHAMDARRHLLYYMTTKMRRVDILKKMGK